MSPIIFVLTFQPIIDFLIQNENFGVEINEKKVITLPYADDFCLITTNMRTQQKIISQLNSHIQSMGMELKPSKCRTFSIKSGKSSQTSFHIGDMEIPSIAVEEQKFLGKVIFFTGKSQETLDYFKSVIKKKLSHIDNTMIRSEYKMWIYQHYFLPSIRFLLTVHEITETHLTILDSICNKHIKKWTGVPRSGTNLVFHMQEGLGIHTIKALYEETHANNHTSMRLKGDVIVNASLDNAISRESQLVRKKSSIVRAENTHMTAINMNCQGGEIPLFPDHKWDREKVKFVGAVKSTVKTLIRETTRENNTKHLNKLYKQSEFLKLAQQEQKDPIWKAFIWNLKSGTAKFLLNSTIHTLQTMNNLKLWNKPVSLSD